jgi:hypothetical protein
MKPKQRAQLRWESHLNSFAGSFGIILVGVSGAGEEDAALVVVGRLKNVKVKGCNTRHNLNI